MPDAIENTENAKLATKLYLSEHSYVTIYNGVTGWGVQLIEGDGFIPVETFDSFSIQSFSLAIAENIQSDKLDTYKHILLEFDKKLKRILWKRFHLSSTGDWTEIEKLSICNSGEIQHFEKENAMEQLKKPGIIETVENGIILYLQEGQLEIDFSTTGWRYRLQNDATWKYLNDLPDDTVVECLGVLELYRADNVLAEIIYRALTSIKESSESTIHGISEHNSLLCTWRKDNEQRAKARSFIERPTPFNAIAKVPLCIEKAVEERRTLLTEECSEVIKSLCKIDRFGEYTQYANERNNLESEIGDLVAAISLMVEAGDVDVASILTAASSKLKKFRMDPSLMSKQDPLLLKATSVCFYITDPALVNGESTDRTPSEKKDPLQSVSDNFYFRYENGCWEFRFEQRKNEPGSERWLTLSELSDAQLLIAKVSMTESRSYFPDSLKSLIEGEIDLRGNS